MNGEVNLQYKRNLLTVNSK